MECGAVWVRVSLGAYFSDERARCMMMVPSGGGARRAGWLARRLRRTFGLPRRPALLCQGHLLPPAEPLPTRAPLLQLEAVPPSGRVVDVSRQRASDDDSDSPAARVRSASERLPPPPAPDQDYLPKDEVDGAGEPPSPAPSPTLDEMKRRALALLEGQAAGGRRRRRVRRRRPPAPSPSPPPPPEVLRNEADAPRAPRHVRALSPPPSAEPAPALSPMPGGHDPFLTS